jgi:hypothetical protein
MRSAMIFYLAAVFSAHGQTPSAPKPAQRHGVDPDIITYPQATPKETLASVLKAIESNKIKYLLAQLSDPQWVDQRVKDVHGGKFAAMVEETAAKLANDRASIKELQRFSMVGTWEIKDATATATLADVPNRRVHMKKIEGRWFLESRQQPAETKEK